MSLREDILATLRRVELDAEVLRSRAALDEIRAIVGHGNDAAFLRREYKEEGGVQGMVESAVLRFRDGGAE
jgi:carboxylate-amine ligase